MHELANKVELAHSAEGPVQSDEKIPDYQSTNQPTNFPGYGPSLLAGSQIF